MSHPFRLHQLDRAAGLALYRAAERLAFSPQLEASATRRRIAMLACDLHDACFDCPESHFCTLDISDPVRLFDLLAVARFLARPDVLEELSARRFPDGWTPSSLALRQYADDCVRTFDGLAHERLAELAGLERLDREYLDLIGAGRA